MARHQLTFESACVTRRCNRVHGAEVGASIGSGLVLRFPPTVGESLREQQLNAAAAFMRTDLVEVLRAARHWGDEWKAASRRAT